MQGKERNWLAGEQLVRRCGGTARTVGSKTAAMMRDLRRVLPRGRERVGPLNNAALTATVGFVHLLARFHKYDFFLVSLVKDRDSRRGLLPSLDCAPARRLVELDCWRRSS